MSTESTIAILLTAIASTLYLGAKAEISQLEESLTQATEIANQCEIRTDGMREGLMLSR